MAHLKNEPISTHARTHIHIHTHWHIHQPIYTRVHICMYARTCTYTHLWIRYTQIHAPIHIKNKSTQATQRKQNMFTRMPMQRKREEEGERGCTRERKRGTRRERGSESERKKWRKERRKERRREGGKERKTAREKERKGEMEKWRKSERENEREYFIKIQWYHILHVWIL